jgi:hypothetical protein
MCQEYPSQIYREMEREVGCAVFELNSSAGGNGGIFLEEGDEGSEWF